MKFRRPTYLETESDNNAATEVTAQAALSPDALLIALHEQQKQIAEKDRLNTELQASVDKQRELIKNLLEELQLARHKRFAPSSEKSSPEQTELFNEAEQLADATADTEVTSGEVEQDTNATSDTTGAEPRKKSGRKGLNPDLPRERIEHRLSDAEREGAVDTFFTKVKEELHIEPAKACVREHWQEKAVFEDKGERTVVTATRPKHPLGKCIASAELLAWILVAKYADGLPLHRLESVLKRYGGEITRSAMANWVIRLAERLEPLLQLLYAEQKRSEYLQIDETRIQVHKEYGKDPRSQKYMWVMRGGPPNRPIVRFHYDPSRGQSVVHDLLDGFAGRYVQSDGYAAYSGATQTRCLVHLGCWDHARRKFKEAEAAQPKTQKTKGLSKATMALSLINALYRIEREITDLDVAERYEARQAKSIKALDKLHISNCLAENAIRPFVIGRKAWLFADTPRGAKASAAFYTLIETAKANGVEPYAYLVHVIRHIAGAETEADLSQLLPWVMR